MEVKEKETAVTQGESSFSQNLEEGEIDEPYVPEYVDRVFTTEEFTADEAQVDEEDEFADEYAFHDDCLLSGVQEIITDKHPSYTGSSKKKAGEGKKSPEKKTKRERCDLERRTTLG